MNQEHSKSHTLQVEAWMAQTIPGLTSEQLISLFSEAIRVLQKRTLITLSEVTLNAVFDRVLHQSQMEFPLLSEVKIDSKGLSFDGIPDHHKPAEITEAFLFFLIELMTILENLTAGILTKPLYKELFGITGERRPSTNREVL